MGLLSAQNIKRKQLGSKLENKLIAYRVILNTDMVPLSVIK